jgi:hypothetical protein
MRRSINRVLRAPAIEHDLRRNSEVIHRVSADLVADLARMAHIDEECFLDWPRVTVEYFVESGLDEYGDTEFTITGADAAQFIRIHASVVTVAR